MSAGGARISTSTLSVLLAIAVALLPSVPVLTLYLPARRKRRREAASIGRALSSW